MKPTKEILSYSQNTCDDWSYAQLRPVSRRVNRILNQLHIQQAFHDACVLFDALHRWDVFRHFRTYIPKKAVPMEGRQFLIPAQLDCSDWRYEVRGRHPHFFDYTQARSCHWMAPCWLLVAKQLYPQCNWMIASSDLHTSVIDFDSKLLFDPYYQEVRVSTKASLQMMFGKAFDNPNDCGIYDDSEPYDNSRGMSGVALTMWNLAEEFTGTEEELVKLMNTFITCDDDKEFEEAVEKTGDELAENLCVMAERDDQYSRSN